MSVTKAFLSKFPLVRHVEATGNVWLAGNDVAAKLGYSNRAKAIGVHVPKHMKRSLKDLVGKAKGLESEKTGNDLAMMYVSETGLKRLIGKSRQPAALSLLDMCGFESLRQIKTPTIEQEIMHSIKDAFPDKVMSLQHAVKTTTDTYYIDLVFPEYKLAVECDEHNHVSYDSAEDAHRESACMVWAEMENIIRFDPHAKDFDIFKLIGKIRMTMQRLDQSTLKKQCLDIACKALA